MAWSPDSSAPVPAPATTGLRLPAGLGGPITAASSVLVLAFSLVQIFKVDDAGWSVWTTGFFPGLFGVGTLIPLLALVAGTAGLARVLLPGADSRRLATFSLLQIQMVAAAGAIVVWSGFLVSILAADGLDRRAGRVELGLGMLLLFVGLVGVAAGTVWSVVEQRRPAAPGASTVAAPGPSAGPGWAPPPVAAAPPVDPTATWSGEPGAVVWETPGPPPGAAGLWEVPPSAPAPGHGGDWSAPSPAWAPAPPAPGQETRGPSGTWAAPAGSPWDQPAHAAPPAPAWEPAGPAPGAETITGVPADIWAPPDGEAAAEIAADPEDQPSPAPGPTSAPGALIDPGTQIISGPPPAPPEDEQG